MSDPEKRFGKAGHRIINFFSRTRRPGKLLLCQIQDPMKREAYCVLCVKQESFKKRRMIFQQQEFVGQDLIIHIISDSPCWKN